MRKVREVTDCFKWSIFRKLESSVQSRRLDRQTVNDCSADNELIRELWEENILKKDGVIIGGENYRVNHICGKQGIFTVGIIDESIQHIEDLNRLHIAY